MNITEVAKRVRSDIKSQFPGVVASVRISRYSMGQSLTVTVKSVPAPISRDALELLVSEYNFDGSDICSDYFHVKFYAHVEVPKEMRIERTQWERDEEAAVAQ